MNARTNLLVPDVILDHRVRILADRRDEITVRPEIRLPIVLLKDGFSIFLSREPGSLRLYYVDKTPRGGEGIRLEEDVHMVLFPIHFEDHMSFLPEDIADCAVHDLFHSAGQDRVVLLCHQHHMVLKQEAAVAVSIVGLAILFLEHIFDSSFTSMDQSEIGRAHV